ncbi:hypothetical protein CHQ89_04100 [Acinetobacter baumannii]|nr:hypothetical protein CHQ89_04100 [Acinetobacter baumannii]
MFKLAAFSLINLFLSFSTSAIAACALFVPCCPDGTPVGPSGVCSSCQLSKSCGSSSSSSSSQQSSAGNCVRQTQVGATNTWEYSNSCNRAVAATITRTCLASGGPNVGAKRSVVVVIQPHSNYQFDRRQFQNFCETIAGNTNSEGVSAQYFTD